MSYPFFGRGGGIRSAPYLTFDLFTLNGFAPRSTHCSLTLNSRLQSLSRRGGERNTAQSVGLLKYRSTFSKPTSRPFESLLNIKKTDTTFVVSAFWQGRRDSLRSLFNFRLVYVKWFRSSLNALFTHSKFSFAVAITPGRRTQHCSIGRLVKISFNF